MADTKITALTALTGADPANDVIPIVDVSDTTMAASGTTKKISVNNILGASGTATLASATITGDLTVDTSTLKVDSANNRVGIGTASPSAALDVNGASNLNGNVTIANTGSPFGTLFVTGSALELQANSNATNGLSLKTTSTTPIIFSVNSSEAMRLNSTGLGVGVSPTVKLDVSSTSTGIARFVNNLTSTYVTWKDGTSDVGYVGSGASFLSGLARTEFGIASAGSLVLGSNNARSVTIDTSGNVGIGVTPSAWGSNWKANHVGTVGSFASSGAGSAPPTAMVIGAYNDNTNWKYQFSSTGAARYEMTGANVGSAHAWYTAPGGTANNNITFTQAMTLDASGNLLVGTTNTSATAGVGFKSQFSSTVPQFAIVVNEAGTSTNFSIYNVNAAAYRFYVNNGGTVFATNTTISAISDARLKENVQDIDVGLGAILALKPRKFDWKAGKGKDIKGDRGFIAQEFEQVFPQLVDEWKDEAPEGEAPYKSVRQDLIPVLVKAIQELTARVQTLETR